MTVLWANFTTSPKISADGIYLSILISTIERYSHNSIYTKKSILGIKERKKYLANS